MKLVHCIEVFDCEDLCIVANPQLRGYHALADMEAMRFQCIANIRINCGASGKQLYTWLIFVNHGYQKLLRKMSKLPNHVKIFQSIIRCSQHSWLLGWRFILYSAWPLVPLLYSLPWHLGMYIKVEYWRKALISNRNLFCQGFTVSSSVRLGVWCPLLIILCHPAISEPILNESL